MGSCLENSHAWKLVHFQFPLKSIVVIVKPAGDVKLGQELCMNFPAFYKWADSFHKKQFPKLSWKCSHLSQPELWQQNIQHESKQWTCAVYENCMTLFAFVCGVCLRACGKSCLSGQFCWERKRGCSKMEHLSTRFILILLESYTLI